MTNIQPARCAPESMMRSPPTSMRGGPPEAPLAAGVPQAASQNCDFPLCAPNAYRSSRCITTEMPSGVRARS
jgi:hypothetical protein